MLRVEMNPSQLQVQVSFFVAWMFSSRPTRMYSAAQGRTNDFRLVNSPLIEM